MLKLGKGRHPIVNPIEQDQDHQTSKRTKTEPDQ